MSCGCGIRWSHYGCGCGCNRCTSGGSKTAAYDGRYLRIPQPYDPAAGWPAGSVVSTAYGLFTTPTDVPSGGPQPPAPPWTAMQAYTGGGGGGGAGLPTGGSPGQVLTVDSNGIPHWAAGTPGPQGPEGPPGTPGSVASAGPWQDSNTYNRGALVTHQGAGDTTPTVYIAKQDGLIGAATEPGRNDQQWQRLALEMPDTGWRNLGSGVLDNGWQLFPGYTEVKVRRYGNFVFLQTGLQPPSSQTLQGITALSVPAGFHGSTQTVAQLINVLNGATEFVWLTAFPDGHVEVTSSTAKVSPTPNRLVGVVATWSTTDPWPTTLPGTATSR